jgi:hypothetical protein
MIQQSNLEVQENCQHPGVGAKTLRCPDCMGFMRRCCDSTFGNVHREPCEEKRWRADDNAKEN